MNQETRIDVSPRLELVLNRIAYLHEQREAIDQELASLDAECLALKQLSAIYNRQKKDTIDTQRKEIAQMSKPGRKAQPGTTNDVYTAIELHPVKGVSHEELRTLTGFSKKSIYESIHRLVISGRVVKDNSTQRFFTAQHYESRET